MLVRNLLGLVVGTALGFVVGTEVTGANDGDTVGEVDGAYKIRIVSKKIICEENTNNIFFFPLKTHVFSIFFSNEIKY